MKKITFFKTLIVTIALFIGNITLLKAESIIPKLYLTARNTPSGDANWTITSAAINNATTDYWKMLSGSSLESTTMNFSLFTNIQIALSLQSFGTIVSHSDDIKIEYWDGTTWTQVGSNLHTSSTLGTQTVLLPYTFANTKIKITAPNATAAAGARVLSVDITGTAAGTTAAPTFSVPTGNYITTQSVSLSATTSGAVIYYTTNGTDPTTSSTTYSTPISITSTTTIKAIAVASGQANSPIATATYTFPTNIASIAALRSSVVPGFYKLTGEAVLTFKSTTRNTKYIQDATDAVVIDDASGIITTGYNIGDGITGIIGTTALYNNMLQLTPVTDPGAATSTGKSVNPTTIALNELINNQGKLVKVLGVSITGTGNFAVSTSYNLNNSTSTVIRTQYADLDYITTPTAIPTSSQDITGVVLVYTTTAQLVPRSASDFANSTGATGIQDLKQYSISASNGKITLSANAGEAVEIYNAVGQKLISKQAVEGVNTIAISAHGVVLVKVGNRIAKVIL